MAMDWHGVADQPAAFSSFVHEPVFACQHYSPSPAAGLGLPAWDMRPFPTEMENLIGWATTLSLFGAGSPNYIHKVSAACVARRGVARRGWLAQRPRRPVTTRHHMQTCRVADSCTWWNCQLVDTVTSSSTADGAIANETWT
ncbi:hypothetical protein E4U53_006954 [Claviceps sorghi]|nr:hypothetical protein E4U53_006954 [Claviceps sorghi]